MFKVLDDLSCQLFHGQWAEVVSYSRQGAWRCTKPGCASQARYDCTHARLPQQRRSLASFQAAPARRKPHTQHAA
jgi:hypothetical protein